MFRGRRQLGPLRPLLLFAAILFVGIVLLPAWAISPPAASDLLSVVPGATSFDHRIRPLDFYRMKDASGGTIGAAFITSLIPPVVVGYRGEIDVLVGIDREGQITGAKILGHRETPEVMRKVLDSNFLRRFVGRKASDDFVGIEAMTGATISSQAIIDDVRTAAQAVAREIVGSGALLPPTPLRIDFGPWAGGAAVMLLIGGSVAATCVPRKKWIRRALLVLSVVVIGLWLNTPVTVGDLIDLRNLVIPGFAKAALLLLIAFGVLSAFWRGNCYCAYLCPFGALQEGAAALNLPKCHLDAKTDRRWSWLRWIVAIAAIYAIAAEGSQAARTMEPFALCFARDPVRPVLIQTGVVLAAALFVRRVWCRFLCPTGLVFDLLALLGAKGRHAIAQFRRRRHASAGA